MENINNFDNVTYTFPSGFKVTGQYQDIKQYIRPQTIEHAAEQGTSSRFRIRMPRVSIQFA